MQGGAGTSRNQKAKNLREEIENLRSEIGIRFHGGQGRDAEDDDTEPLRVRLEKTLKRLIEKTTPKKSKPKKDRARTEDEYDTFKRDTLKKVKQILAKALRDTARTEDEYDTLSKKLNPQD